MEGRVNDGTCDGIRDTDRNEIPTAGNMAMTDIVIKNAKRACQQTDIGKRIDDALSLIELENPKLKGILDKHHARVQLPDGMLGELVDLVSKIGFGESGKVEDRAKNHARDLLGPVSSLVTVRDKWLTGFDAPAPNGHDYNMDQLPQSYCHAARIHTPGHERPFTTVAVANDRTGASP